MSNIWFTSDYHFNHNKDFIYKERGFKDIESMNETLVQRHNSLVRPDDIVYVLGDVVMGNIYEGAQYVKRLNGHLRIIKGNHDTDNKVKFLQVNAIISNGYLMLLSTILARLKTFFCVIIQFFVVTTIANIK